jgi:hypothetical protein
MWAFPAFEVPEEAGMRVQNSPENIGCPRRLKNLMWGISTSSAALNNSMYKACSVSLNQSGWAETLYFCK